MSKNINAFNLNEILKKYNILPKGIIHIGGHLGEEYDLYKSLNLQNKTIWIEANPEQIDQLKKNVNNDIVINEAVSDKEELVNFYITKNSKAGKKNKESSSLKELDYHLIAHPSVSVNKIIKVKTKKMINIIGEYDIDMTQYNFLNIDTQGSELDIFKSFGNEINNIDYIYSEVNVKSLYKDIGLLPEIDDYLKEKGFKRVEKKIHNKVGWGQAFYIR
jgi:FkbM family methyltransferase